MSDARPWEGAARDFATGYTGEDVGRWFSYVRQEAEDALRDLCGDLPLRAEVEADAAADAGLERYRDPQL